MIVLIGVLCLFGLVLQENIKSTRFNGVKFLHSIEKKFGRYAVSNLSVKIVICFTIAYFLWLAFPDVYELLIFDVTYVFAGHEYWRIFTWIFTMPGSVSGFTILMLFIYVGIGNSVERSVGRFLYNVYIWTGIILITVGQFVSGLIVYMRNKDMYDYIYDTLSPRGTMYGEALVHFMSDIGPTYFMSIAVFLGFAMVYSDSMMLFMFILPVKAAWLAYVDLAVMGYYFIKYDDWVMRSIILAVVINYFLFSYILKNYRARKRFNASTEQLKKRKEFRDRVREQEIKYSPDSNITRHKCAICGRSERDGDELEFRFCSKCNGNYEYCNEHLFTHEHVK